MINDPSRRKARLRQLISAPCIVAFGLAACSNYKATLVGADHPAFQDGEPLTEARVVLPQDAVLDPGDQVVPPAPIETKRVVEGEPKVSDPGGYVRLRFDISDQGSVTNVRVVDIDLDTYDKDGTGKEQYKRAAMQLMETWEMTPGTVNGEPAGFQDVETVMRFDEYTSAGEVIGATAAVIVLLPLAVLLGAGANSHFSMGS